MKKTLLLSTCLCFSVMIQQIVYGAEPDLLRNNPQRNYDEVAVLLYDGRPTQIPTETLVKEFHDVGYTAQDVMDEVDSVISQYSNDNPDKRNDLELVKEGVSEKLRIEIATLKGQLSAALNKSEDLAKKLQDIKPELITALKDLEQKKIALDVALTPVKELKDTFENNEKKLVKAMRAHSDAVSFLQEQKETLQDLINQILQTENVLSAASVGAQGEKNRRKLEQLNKRRIEAEKEEATLKKTEELTKKKVIEFEKIANSLENEILKEKKKIQASEDTLRHAIKTCQANYDQVTMRERNFNDDVTQNEKEILKIRAIIRKKLEVQKKIRDRKSL